MYNGTDMLGNQSPLTRYASSRDYGRFPILPDPDQPYFGPGYKLDFPETDGNCAACHTPAASVNDPYGVDPTNVTGVPAEGVPCDFCHKIWDVKLNPTSGFPSTICRESYHMSSDARQKGINSLLDHWMMWLQAKIHTHLYSGKASSAHPVTLLYFGIQ